MTRPPLEVADILRGRAIASWIGIDRALIISSSKPFVPFNAAALPPSAGIAMLALVAGIRPSPTTRVAIATAQSVMWALRPAKTDENRPEPSDTPQWLER